MAVVAEKKLAHEKYLEEAGFAKLVSSRAIVVAVLTVLTLVTYYGFIFLMAYGKDVLSTKISSNITLGLPIGAAVIIISWVFTFIYARWANNTYDRMVEEIKAKIGG